MCEAQAEAILTHRWVTRCQSDVVMTRCQDMWHFNNYFECNCMHVTKLVFWLPTKLAFLVKLYCMLHVEAMVTRSSNHYLISNQLQTDCTDLSSGCKLRA